jgi:hypothetical protein
MSAVPGSSRRRTQRGNLLSRVPTRVTPANNARSCVGGRSRRCIAFCPSGLTTMNHPSRSFRFLGVASILMIIGLAGCNAVDVVPDDQADPGGTFELATPVGFDAARSARITGTVALRGDLDVFLLGTLVPGERLLIDASTPDSPLDVTMAVFDSEQRLVYDNDDRETGDSLFLDSYIDFVVRHAGNPYYLAVSHSPFAESGTVTGGYRIDVGIDSGFEVPEPVGQTLLLDFDGGDVDSPALGPTTIRPFSARAISPIYRAQTELLKQLIRDTVEQNFERFDVTVLTSDDPPPPPGEEFSTVFVGGLNEQVFGIAEQVDLYNTDFCDDAIVYSESFSPATFSYAPTIEELGVAIGNIIAHEAGHILGLNHVDDETAIMDGASPADTFLQDQEFKEAVLSSDILPLGVQDAPMLLSESVGLRE